MKRPVLVSAIPALLVVVASISWASSNLNLSKSNIYMEFPGAQIVTATTGLSGPSPQTVYTAPATGDFILTQLCTSSVKGGVLLGVSGFGYLAQTRDDQLCYTFTPGVSVRPGSALICLPASGAATSGNDFCTISGTFTPPAPAPTPIPTPIATPTATPSPPVA